MILHTILESQLTWLAKMRLARSRPKIVAITGNVGKSSSKEAIHAGLKDQVLVRKSEGNLNNEIGLPLSILGNWDVEYYDKGPSPRFWIKVLVAEFFKCIFMYKEKAQVLILEYGADKPGDIKKLAAIFKPDVAVVTAVGDVPVHIEFFNSADHLADEKFNLIRAAKANNGIGIINLDDARLSSLAQNESGMVTFGSSSDADYMFHDYAEVYEGEKLKGSSLKIVHRDKEHLLSVGAIGRSSGYSLCIALAVASALGLDLDATAHSLSSNYKGLKGRLSVLEGINGSTIIDDTYNASPASTELALKTLESLKAKRKIAILGDMLELGSHSQEAHKKIGYTACRFVDGLVCVGPQSIYIAQEAERLLSKENIHWFEKSDDAISYVKNLVSAGDLILIKGSQGMRMEKIVAAIISEKEDKKNRLVRQSNRWLSK